MSIEKALQWYDSIQDDVSYKVESNKNAFATLFNALMMEQGITRAELAERINKSAPYVSKVLRGDTNLTISSMTKLLDAIDCELHINACHKTHNLKWVNVISGGATEELETRDKEISSLWAERVRHGNEAA